MDLKFWISQSRQNNLHPYIISFLLLHPHMWIAEQSEAWYTVDAFLHSLDKTQGTLDSEFVVQPVLLSLLGPTNTAMFFEFCQEQMVGRQPDAVFTGLVVGHTGYSLQSVLPLVDSVLYIFRSVILELQSGVKKDPSNWAEYLGEDGRAAVINMFRWLVMVVKSDQDLLYHVFDWGTPNFWNDVESMINHRLLSLAQPSFMELKTSYVASLASEKESG